MFQLAFVASHNSSLDDSHCQDVLTEDLSCYWASGFLACDHRVAHMVMENDYQLM